MVVEELNTYSEFIITMLLTKKKLMKRNINHNKNFSHY